VDSSQFYPLTVPVPVTVSVVTVPVTVSVVISVTLVVPAIPSAIAVPIARVVSVVSSAKPEDCCDLYWNIGACSAYAIREPRHSCRKTKDT